MESHTDRSPTNEEEPRWLFYGVMVPHYLLVMVLGALLENVAIVFSVLGALSSSSICLILPSFFYFALVRKYDKPKRVKYYLAWGMFVFFIIFGVFAVGTKFINS